MRTVTTSELSHLNIEPAEVRFAPSDPAGEHNITYLITDSRDLTAPGETVFAALRTGVNDGHRYIPELFRQGVRTFIVEQLSDDLRGLDAAFIVVPSVEEALRRMAYARVRGYSNGIIVTAATARQRLRS